MTDSFKKKKIIFNFFIEAEKQKKIIIIEDDDDVQECKPEEFRSQSRDKLKTLKPNFNEPSQYPAFIIKEDNELIPPLVKEKQTKIIVLH